MMRHTAPKLMSGACVNGGVGIFVKHLFLPRIFRSSMPAASAQRIERMSRNLQAVKQNKVDLRQLLALPVYDPAHPYYVEKPWEVYFKQEQPPEATSFVGKLRKSESLGLRELCCVDQGGLFNDDTLSEWFFTVRQAVRRLPMDQRQWRQRRTTVFHMIMGGGGLGHLPMQYWVHPVDDVAYIQGYALMANDEWEEKYGFMAGEEITF
eukprot:TRINITY_DN5644_c0_g1_i1.p2 TRINITY_DN5644_c0_g1~~TRINITY_DN5644_c0_g1_i1.p2  ORF type:complete len:208 (+),score=81.78 TRINITY_DN5644_c0_g1_i1:101-724(+)